MRDGAGDDAYINVCGGFYGPALGLARELAFPTNSLQLEPGDRLAVFTDGIDEAACSLDTAIALVAADEERGIGDAPWPPHYPKMPGEPPRVQPSKRKKA